MACSVVGGARPGLAGHGQEASHLDLQPVPRAAAQARQFVSDVAGSFMDDEQLALAHLLVSELVTNGVLYGRTALQVGVSRRENEVLITVQDGNDELPPDPGMPPASSLLESGRGMALVREFASSDGSNRLADKRGKVVWFTIQARSQASAAGS